MKKIVMVCIMILLVMPLTFAEDEVVVTLPGFDISLNGGIVDNDSEVYPFIQYKGITYLPMTWDMSFALGLELKWDNITGLKVGKRDKMVPYAMKKTRAFKLSKTLKAKIVEFPVNVNGVQIDNATEEYPLLEFQNVTYFPMTYGYMVGDFNTGYKWDDEKGLSISANKSLKVEIPEPKKYEFDIDWTTFDDDTVITEDMITLKKYSHGIGVFIMDGTYPEYDNYIIDVDNESYDAEGQLIGMSYLKFNRHIYNGVKRSQWGALKCVINKPHFSNHQKLIITFEPVEYTRARLLEKHGDLPYEIYSDYEITLEAIKSSGAYYVEGMVFDAVDPKYPLDLVRFDAAEFLSGVKKPDDHVDYKVLTTSDGGYVYHDKTSNYMAVHSLSKLFIDPTQVKLKLTAMSGSSITGTAPSEIIRLYDKELKLIKVLIHESEIENLK